MARAILQMLPAARVSSHSSRPRPLLFYALSTFLFGMGSVSFLRLVQSASIGFLAFWLITLGVPSARDTEDRVSFPSLVSCCAASHRSERSSAPCASAALRPRFVFPKSTSNLTFSCFPTSGWVHSSGRCAAAGPQPGGGHPAGERHQGQGEVTGSAHRRPKGRHQVGGALAAERPQCRRAVQGNAPLPQR